MLFLLVLGVLLAVQAWLLLQDRRAAAEAAPADAAAYGTAGLEPQPAPARIVIKCKQCGEVFPVEDTGARPLVAACPRCGRSGTIRVKADG